MSNRRKPRRAAAERRPSATAELEERAGITSRQVRGAFYHLGRRGHVVRSELELSEVSGRREQKWALSTLGRQHGSDRGVTVTIQSRRTTAAGLLKARLSQADGLVRQGDLVRVIHAPTGSAGGAHVRRVVERTGQVYLEADWDATIERPVFRTQAHARAEARERPEPCPSCGAATGSDCVTSGGRTAAWPHAARDPILSKSVRAVLTPAGLR